MKGNYLMVPREGRCPNACDANFPFRPNPWDCGVTFNCDRSIKLWASLCVSPSGGTQPSDYWLSWCISECIREGESRPCRARFHAPTQWAPRRRTHRNMKHVVSSVLFQEPASSLGIPLSPTPLGMYSCLGEQNQSLCGLVLLGLEYSWLFLGGL